MPRAAKYSSAVVGRGAPAAGGRQRPGMPPGWRGLRKLARVLRVEQVPPRSPDFGCGRVGSTSAAAGGAGAAGALATRRGGGCCRCGRGGGARSRIRCACGGSAGRKGMCPSTTAFASLSGAASPSPASTLLTSSVGAGALGWTATLCGRACLRGAAASSCGRTGSTAGRTASAAGRSGSGVCGTAGWAGCGEAKSGGAGDGGCRGSGGLACSAGTADACSGLVAACASSVGWSSGLPSPIAPSDISIMAGSGGGGSGETPINRAMAVPCRKSDATTAPMLLLCAEAIRGIPARRCVSRSAGTGVSRTKMAPSLIMRRRRFARLAGLRRAGVRQLNGNAHHQPIGPGSMASRLATIVSARVIRCLMLSNRSLSR